MEPLALRAVADHHLHRVRVVGHLGPEEVLDALLDRHPPAIHEDGAIPFISHGFEVRMEHRMVDPAGPGARGARKPRPRRCRVMASVGASTARDGA